MKHPFDVHLGSRLRDCRCSAGMTRAQLAARLGVNTQRIRDFEAGEDRISSSLLRNIVAEMEVPAAFFFEGLEGALGAANSPDRR